MRVERRWTSEDVIDQLSQLIDIERIDYIRNSINAFRNDLPDGAAETEKKSVSYDQQTSTGKLT